MNENPSIWLSVILPTYQGENHLDDALASVAAQAAADIEIIILDDGSTDTTRKIIESWQSKLNIVPVWLEHSGNWVKNTNLGFQKARGEWVTILHQDDVWLPNRMKVLRELADTFPSVDYFLHPVLFIDDSGKKVGKWRCPLPGNRPLDPGFVLPRLVVQNFISIISPMFRNTMLEKTGMMDEQLWYFADWDLWLKLAEQGQLVYSPEPLASFRIHVASQTSTRTSNLEEVGRQFDETVKDVLKSPAFPSKKIKRAERMEGFAREMYMYMLSVVHGKKRSKRGIIREAFRTGPFGVIRYIRHSRLIDRLIPRLRLHGKKGQA